MRQIEGNYHSERRISLYIKDDYVRGTHAEHHHRHAATIYAAGHADGGILKHGIKL